MAFELRVWEEMLVLHKLGLFSISQTYYANMKNCSGTRNAKWSLISPLSMIRTTLPYNRPV